MRQRVNTSKGSGMIISSARGSDNLVYEVLLDGAEDSEMFYVHEVSIEDTVVNEVRADLKSRSEVGINKYNTTLDREDLKLKDWLQNSYEEALDMALYLKRAIREL
jgi:phage FluMu gp28-like protein